MGLIRSGAVVFFSALLFLSIFLGNVFLTISWSLEYETLEPNLKNFTTEIIEDMKINKTLTENYNFMLIYCQNQESFNLTEQGLNIEIPCTIIKQGPEKIIEYGIQESIKNIYYQEYNCEFWECIKNTDTVFVLTSEKAKYYWHSKFYLTILISTILLILLIIFIESKKSALTITGALMIVSSIPFRKLNWLFTLLPEGKITEIFSLFFTKSNNVFLTMLIIGSIILLVGLAFEFFNIGFKITKMFRWIFQKKENKKEENPQTKNKTEEKNEEKENLTKEEIKKIVKKEIKKQKLKENIKDKEKEELDNPDKK
jgi:hypothetical protein